MNIKLGVSLLLLMRSGFVVFGASLCLLGDFDSQAKYLLNNEMLTTQELREIALNFDELRETLRARWGDADLFVYGSLPAGLGTKTSDVDVYLRVPGFNNKTQTQIYEETLKVLRQQSKKIDHIVPKPEKAIPRITYFDNSMQRSVDLSFAVSIAMANTKVMKYYFNLDNRSLPLAAIVKFWCKVHELTGKGLLPNYSVYLMIAFYLEHKNMVPSVYQIQANLPPRYADKWNINFEEIPYNVANHETLYELLGGFFKFYSDFNFAKYCVSPFMGRPLAKSNFKDVGNVPEEFSLYVENVNKGYYHPLPIESEICVQDIFNHSGNTAQRVDKAGALKFINHVKLAAKHYDNLPSDKFLRSILTRNKHKKTYTLGKRLEVITILKRKDCLTEKQV